MTATAPIATDRRLDVAERQLEMLSELGNMGMAAARAYTASAIASAGMAETILLDKFFMPEVGRANACGAKEAAESLQKIMRALRLTLMLEKATVEWMHDLETGAPRKDAGGDAAAPAETPHLLDRSARTCPGLGAGGLADSDPAERSPDRDRRESESESLVEFERPDILPRAPFRETVDLICADLEAEVDWNTWTVGRSDPSNQSSPPGSSARAQTRTAGVMAEPAPASREAALSP